MNCFQCIVLMGSTLNDNISNNIKTNKIDEGLKQESHIIIKDK